MVTPFALTSYKVRKEIIILGESALEEKRPTLPVPELFLLGNQQLLLDIHVR